MGHDPLGALAARHERFRLQPFGRYDPAALLGAQGELDRLRQAVVVADIGAVPDGGERRAELLRDVDGTALIIASLLRHHERP